MRRWYLIAALFFHTVVTQTGGNEKIWHGKERAVHYLPGGNPSVRGKVKN